jgi:hypothetical protein
MGACLIEMTNARYRKQRGGGGKVWRGKAKQGRRLRVKQDAACTLAVPTALSPSAIRRVNCVE